MYSKNWISSDHSCKQWIPQISLPSSCSLSTYRRQQSTLQLLRFFSLLRQFYSYSQPHIRHAVVQGEEGGAIMAHKKTAIYNKRPCLLPTQPVPRAWGGGSAIPIISSQNMGLFCPAADAASTQFYQVFFHLCSLVYNRERIAGKVVPMCAKVYCIALYYCCFCCNFFYFTGLIFTRVILPFLFKSICSTWLLNPAQ